MEYQNGYRMVMKTRHWKPSDLIAVGDRTQSLTEWARSLTGTPQAIISRLDAGWDEASAVTTPIGERGGANRGRKFPKEDISGEPVMKLLAACNRGASGVRDRALIVIGYRAGLRCAEALALKPADLNPHNGTIRVLGGKGGKDRTVGMDGTAWDTVQKWIDLRSSLGLAHAKTLFCTIKDSVDKDGVVRRAGQPLPTRQVRAKLQRLGKKAGVEQHAHFHNLRSAMACELAREGVPMPSIQAQLGHSNLATTDIYLRGLMPVETVNRMRERAWTGHLPGSASAMEGWLDRLKTELGPRLKMLVDGRSDPERFEAVVVLMASPS